MCFPLGPRERRWEPKAASENVCSFAGTSPRSLVSPRARRDALPMMDDLPPLAAELEQLDRDGFLILEGLLSEQERAAIVAAIAPYEASRPMGRNDFEGCLTQRVYSLAGKGDA